jgi:hypothetical protein
MITERAYTSGEEVASSFFIGTEVEHSKFFGEKTLFVIEIQSDDEILKLLDKHNCTHVYLGANMSFNPSLVKAYTFLINLLVTCGYKVTLDFDISHYELVTSHVKIAGISTNNLALMVSVKLPEIETYADSVYVKVDDAGFNYSNKGVWVHSARSLMAANETTWDKYTTDEVIK